MQEVLRSLLENIDGLSDQEAEEHIRGLYIELYTDKKTGSGRRGERLTHDNQPVYFYEDRFGHAFRTSSDRASRLYAKDRFDRKRGERVRWIGQVIRGNISGAECWVCPPEGGGYRGPLLKRPGRLYILWDEQYAVFLNAAGKGDAWKFSTAYLTGRGHLRRYTSEARLIWRKELPRD